MIDKHLAFVADARTAGLVVGEHVPIVLTSRGPREPPRAFWPAAFPRPQSDQQWPIHEIRHLWSAGGESDGVNRAESSNIQDHRAKPDELIGRAMSLGP